PTREWCAARRLRRSHARLRRRRSRCAGGRPGDPRRARPARDPARRARARGWCGCERRARASRGRGGVVVSVVASSLDTAVADAAAHLYVWALKDIPQDLRDALGEAAGRETSVTGQRVLQTILRNVTVAEDEKNLVCQDTGIAV